MSGFEYVGAARAISVNRLRTFGRDASVFGWGSARAAQGVAVDTGTAIFVQLLRPRHSTAYWATLGQFLDFRQPPYITQFYLLFFFTIIFPFFF